MVVMESRSRRGKRRTKSNGYLETTPVRRKQMSSLRLSSERLGRVVVGDGWMHACMDEWAMIKKRGNGGDCW
jgi:hypothetical protein